MNFDFSDDQKQMRDAARKFLSEQCPPKAVRAWRVRRAPSPTQSTHCWPTEAARMQSGHA